MNGDAEQLEFAGSANDVVAVLKHVLILLDQGRCWTHYSMARDKHRQACRATSKHARCWCLTGAVIKVARSGHVADDTLYALQTVLRTQLGWTGTLHDYNDADFHHWKDIKKLVTLTIDTYRNS